MARPTPSIYSYIRFSHPDQAKGDSLRRQVDRAREYCKRRGWTLDESLTLRDLGVSAFKGKNAAVGNFRTFLDGITSGKIKPGSVLIVESFDRISRQGIDEGYDLIKRILKADVRIVTLSPEREFDREATRGLSKGALEIQLILERAAEESETKSKRLGPAWHEKKKVASAKRITTRKIPNWIKAVGGERKQLKDTLPGEVTLQLIPEKAQAVRQIFELATAGYGLGAITKRLNADKVPAIGRAAYWARSYVAKILTNRAVIGEYQPYKGHAGPDRKPDGPPIPKYFPKVIERKDFEAVQFALKSRRHKGGRPAKRVNLWTGLLRDARNGGTLHLANKGAKGGGILLASYRATQGLPDAKQITFPLAAFEGAILAQLREIKPRDILPKDAPPDRVPALTEQLERLEAKIDRLKADLVAKDEIDPILDAIRTLEAKRKRMAHELTTARREAATPLEETWKQCRTLLDALQTSPDKADTRTRLRAAIRSIIEGVWCLFCAIGRRRVAAIQVSFQGGGVRSIIIDHEPAHGSASSKRPARTWVDPDPRFTINLAMLDLRNSKDANQAERLLTNLDGEPIKMRPAGKKPRKLTVTIGQRGDATVRAD